MYYTYIHIHTYLILVPDTSTFFNSCFSWTTPYHDMKKMGVSPNIHSKIVV